MTPTPLDTSTASSSQSRESRASDRRTASTLAGFVDPTAAVRKARGTPQFSALADGHPSLYVRVIFQEELKRARASERVSERGVRCDPCAEDGRRVGRRAATEDLWTTAVVRPLHRRADAHVDPGGKERVTLVDADAPILAWRMPEVRRNAGD